jgi:hypothetical protein
MRLPPYIETLNLSALPVDYTWGAVDYDRLWAVNDEDNPRLINALLLVAVKAAFALGTACAEWVVARVGGHVDTADAVLRIEAAWAGSLDRRYAKLPPPPSTRPVPLDKFADPLHLAMKLISYSHELCTGDGEGVRSSTQGLAMLVDHIAGRHPAFSPWLSESLRRCRAHLPTSETPVEEERPVPHELFEPDFVWTEGAVQEALQRFVQTLDPARNPYLRSAEAMRADGFVGRPYGRST